jgi:prepilin-type processing-associated H-X9-DG protein
MKLYAKQKYRLLDPMYIGVWREPQVRGNSFYLPLWHIGKSNVNWFDGSVSIEPGDFDAGNDAWDYYFKDLN